MDVTSLFLQEAALKEQFDDPRAGRFRAQTVGGAQDLLQIFILHKTGDPGHGRKQRRIGEVARRLGLSFNHFALLAQQFVAFGHDRQRRAVVLFVTFFVAEQRAPARFREETRFGDKFAFGNFQFNNALAEHRVRAELHQILTSDQVIDLCFVVGQVDVAGARRRDYRVVSIDFFIVPAAVMGIRVYRRLRQQIRRMDANGIHHRVASGEVFFRQIAAVRTRIGDQLVGFVELLADIEHVLRAKTKALSRLNLQRRKGERQRCGLRFPFVVIAGDDCGLAGNAVDYVLRQRAMQQPSLFVLI